MINLNDEFILPHDHSGEMLGSLREELKDWVLTYYNEFNKKNLELCLKRVIQKFEEGLHFYEDVLEMIYLTSQLMKEEQDKEVKKEND